MKITFHPDVYKQLQRLPRSVFAAALDEIIALAADPRPAGAKKLVGSDSDYRVRIGECRIVYEVDDARGVVTILTVAKRSDAYR